MTYGNLLRPKVGDVVRVKGGNIWWVHHEHEATCLVAVVGWRAGDKARTSSHWFGNRWTLLASGVEDDETANAISALLGLTN